MDLPSCNVLQFRCGYDLKISTEFHCDEHLQHTTKLGHFKRDFPSREGSNIYALWSEKDKTVAVLVRIKPGSMVYFCS